MSMTQTKTLTWNLRPSQELDKQVRYIAWFKRKSLTRVIQDACTGIVNDFEKENGPITAKQLKDAGL